MGYLLVTTNIRTSNVGGGGEKDEWNGGWWVLEESLSSNIVEEGDDVEGESVSNGVLIMSQRMQFVTLQ